LKNELEFEIGLPDSGKIYTKFPQNIPNGGKIYTPNGLKSTQMVIKHTQIFHCKAYKDKAKLGFLV
jgi:hypothetical protein